MTPSEVMYQNQRQVWRNLYSNVPNSPIIFRYEIDDKVRIPLKKHVFEKGYTQNWTEEVFKINERLARTPPVYKIKDLNNKPIKGVFYETELQKVENDDIFIISKILRRRVRNQQVQYFVRWLGYSNEFDSWVNADDVQRQ